MSGVIHTRINEPLHVPDEEQDVPMAYIHNAMIRFERVAKALAMQLEDRTKPVDEYQNGIAGNQLEVLPLFNDQIRERIISVIVFGPANATGTIALGNDFVIPVTIPAVGFVVIAPIAILLDRSDRRLLNLTGNGPIGMRLTGWASGRY